MNNKSLLKVSKKELLEILLEQAKRIDELEEELKITKKKLESKKIAINESGTLAEAALKLNSIFEAADASVKQYILNIEEKYKNIENNTEKNVFEIEKNKVIKETETKSKQKKKIIKGRPIRMIKKRNAN